MSTITVTFESSLAQAFEEVCAEEGLAPEEALLRFVEYVVREGHFPFDIDSKE